MPVCFPVPPLRILVRILATNSAHGAAGALGTRAFRAPPVCKGREEIDEARARTASRDLNARPVWGFVIARSEATKQSRLLWALRSGLLRFARNDGLKLLRRDDSWM